MPRGGKRKGAGRKAPEAEKVTVSYHLKKLTVEMIKAEADERSISASSVADEWLERGRSHPPDIIVPEIS